MPKTAINRVTLVGYLDSDPQTVAENSEYEQITLDVVTRDAIDDQTVRPHIRWKHRVIVLDYFTRQYVHLFLSKGDGVFVEGKLVYISGGRGSNSSNFNGNNAEIIITSDQGALRRLEEPAVKEFF